MGWVKDEYIRLLELRMEVLEAEGYTPEQAYELAGQEAYKLLPDRLADRADRVRQAIKDRWQ